MEFWSKISRPSRPSYEGLLKFCNRELGNFSNGRLFLFLNDRGRCYNSKIFVAVEYISVLPNFHIIKPFVSQLPCFVVVVLGGRRANKTEGFCLCDSNRNLVSEGALRAPDHSLPRLPCAG